MISLLPAQALSPLSLFLSAMVFAVSFWPGPRSTTFRHFLRMTFRRRSQRRGVAPSFTPQLSGPSFNQVSDPKSEHFIRDQTVLITGAAGSIGSELVRQVLQQKPSQVILIDQAESALYTLEATLRQEYDSAVNVVVQIANITDAGRIHRIFATYRPALVFHAAAYKHVPLMEQHPYEAINVNVLGTQLVADMAVRFAVQKFVLISTDKAVNPTSVMGATKRLAEMYVQGLNQQSATRFVVTRFGNVLDSSGSVLPLFRQQIARGGPVTVTHPHVTRYFMTIPEACHLVLEAVILGSGGEVFVFDMGEPVRIADLARQLIQAAGYEVNTTIKLTFTGLRPGEKLHEELLHTTETALLTRHPRIQAARLETPDAYQTQRALRELARILPYADDSTLVQFLQKVVPEYTSRNPLYGQRDFMLSTRSVLNCIAPVVKESESMPIHP
ncbi:UDP-N-acetylglucosamine 4,6-dehydratase family protein [Spirosoma sp. KUDC1026]|uniref:UDP-N-acetylglucosamine 4,6-dehydratase family protein n=1 Tax=Spirosoma sp. KUDC1026 TaxID=2745947 RepID=UPI00159BE53C|nr:UDP-N-acetylglucosamine 4,6-dehydratase family protein [Spirosoma sp. KUDC1026]QKZ15519.1 polysaccharide biosynthesis protein [Spirosoma sp. KUDC1026]